MPVVLQKYQPCDHKGAVAALQSAFIDDPVFLEIYGKKNISKGLEGVFATLLKFRGTDTHVLKDGDEVVGVVIWDIKKFFPLHEEMTVLRREARDLGWCSALSTAWIYLGSLTWVMEGLQKKYKKQMLYVKMVGVSSKHHGKGYGSIMLSESMKLMREERQYNGGFYLESSNPRNVPFYERNGFVKLEAKNWRGCTLTAMVHAASA
eukprot:TRINITY_DN11358_c0_g2_i1.p1 TRINITY_DN11358_c0_g2~~TRINITY_DN11358_c0_g2_i1.p1  ORF type:complete len:216 (+),score=76.63 TRINITY_DN11358_c0_g2_i1:33-650(+)